MNTETDKYPQPPKSLRVTLTQTRGGMRIDQVLLEYLRKQDRCFDLKNISRVAYKNLFKQRRIKIKGQSAVPASGLAVGSTTVDILGFEEKPAE